MGDAPIIGGTPPAGQQGQPGGDAFVVPEQYKDEKVFEGIKTQGDLVKQFVDGQKMIGRGIFMPDDKATPEQKLEAMGRIHTKLGRPDTSGKYKIDLPKLPESVKWDDGFIKSFYEKAHGLGLSNDQLSGVMGAYGEFITSQTKAPGQETREVEAELIKEWGEDGFQRRVTEGTAFARMVGGDMFMQWLEDSGSGNERAMIEFLGKLGHEAVEDGILDSAAVEGAKTNADYMAEALAIIQDQASPYRDPHHAKHKETVDLVEKLLNQSVAK